MKCKKCKAKEKEKEEEEEDSEAFYGNELFEFISIRRLMHSRAKRKGG